MQNLTFYYPTQIYYPTQYYQEVWHYKYANIKFIIKAIDGFNQQRAFSNKNVNEKVDTFDKTILDILSNPTKLYNAMIEIYYGLITKSNPLYTKNAVFKKFCCDRNNNLMKRQRNILQDCSVTSINASK